MPGLRDHLKFGIRASERLGFSVHGVETGLRDLCSTSWSERPMAFEAFGARIFGISPVHGIHLASSHIILHLGIYT